VEDYNKLCLQSSDMTRQGSVLKTQLPKPTVTGEPDKFSPTKKRLFHEYVNEAVHHVLINQSGVLVNTLQNLIKKVDRNDAHLGRVIDDRVWYMK